MLNRQMIDIYHALSKTEYRTANDLAAQLNVSNKTARNWLKTLSRLLRDYGACVESKHAVGYRLMITDAEKLKSLEKQLHHQEHQQSSVPNLSAERVQHLLKFLLNADCHVKMEDLSEQMYISRWILSGNMKEVKRVLESYDLHLSCKPGHGILVEGAEFNRRLCMADYATNRIWDNGKLERVLNSTDEIIYQCVRECFAQTGFMMTDVALMSLLLHLQIAVMRMLRGHYMPALDTELEHLRGQKAYQVAEKILGRLCEEFHINCCDSEVAYIASHLQGKEMAHTSQETGGNIVVTPEISGVVDDMLQMVYLTFGLDFRKDMESKLLIGQHMVFLVVRLKNKMRLYNPLLQSIKGQYLLAYNIAAAASQVIVQRYHTALEEDEIGYLALLFELALEHEHTEIRKKNILLVNMGGQISDCLSLNAYKKAFGESVGDIAVCDVYHVHEQDFTNIDYIFTTVPIPVKVPVPIWDVHSFLTGSDVWRVRQALRGGEDIAQAFRPELFLTNCCFDNKQQALQALCNMVEEEGLAPQGFANAVQTREKLAKTFYGNRVAMPVPVGMHTQPFVCVAVLQEPLQWVPDDPKSLVQVILLNSINGWNGFDVLKFYLMASRMMENSDLVQQLTQAYSYTAFINLMENLEHQVEGEWR